MAQGKGGKRTGQAAALVSSSRGGNSLHQSRRQAGKLKKGGMYVEVCVCA